jgi:hypothetical protein
MLFFYILQKNTITKVAYFFKLYHRAVFPDSALSSAYIAPTSEVLKDAMSVLFNVRNEKGIKKGGGFYTG